jgi:hypothetical protein
VPAADGQQIAVEAEDRGGSARSPFSLRDL